MGGMIDRAIQALIREHVERALVRKTNAIIEGLRGDTNLKRFPPDEYVRLYHTDNKDFMP